MEVATFRVIYNEDEQSARLECPRCGKDYELLGNALVIRQDGNVHTSPNAKDVIYNHFNFDENAGTAVCPEPRLTAGTTSWQAMTLDQKVIARGRVIVRQIGNAIQSPDVVQDEPAE